MAAFLGGGMIRSKFQLSFWGGIQRKKSFFQKMLVSHCWWFSALNWLSGPNFLKKICGFKRDIHQVSAKIDIFPPVFCSKKKISNFFKMQSPPAFAAPQLTTRRSGPTIAAKALCVAWISCTSTSCPWTCALSPPEKEAPQVTAVPSWRIAAKAYQVACRGKKWKLQHSTLQVYFKSFAHKASS